MITFWEAPDFKKNILGSIIGNLKRAVWRVWVPMLGWKEFIHHKYLRRLYYCNTLCNFTEKTFWPHHVRHVCLFAATQYTVNLTLEREITDDQGASFYTDLEKMEAASFSLIQEVSSSTWHSLLSHCRWMDIILGENKNPSPSQFLVRLLLSQRNFSEKCLLNSHLPQKCAEPNW